MFSPCRTVGCLHTAAVIGPFLGLLLASFCAELFVDLGSVEAGNRWIYKIVRINWKA